MIPVKGVLSLITFGIVMAILWGGVSAYHLTASTDKLLYEKSDSLGISGTVETSSSVTVYVEIYNSSDSSIKNGSTSSTAAGNVSTFSISIPLANFSPGKYYALVYNTPGDSVRLEFEVVAKKMLFKVRLLNSSDGVVMIDTSDIVPIPGYLGGNFSDFLAAGYQVHYGNASSILVGGKVAHFALINKSAPDVFDTIYLDDDPRFELYNSLEDNSSSPMVETPLKKGDSVGDYIVAEVEFTSGNKVLLAKPSSSSVYTGGDTVYYMVVAKDKAGNILSGKNIKVELRYSNGTVINSTSGTIQNGYFNGSFTAPSVAGKYLITVNDTLGMEVFSVEAFKLFGKITDINNNPTTTFAPNPVVKLTAVAKDMNGNLLTLTSAEALVVYPNGTKSTVQLTKTVQGMYSGELNLKGAPTGEYGVKFRASDNSTMQEISMGFTIAESRAELYAINVQFIDQADEGGIFVSAFHPSSNVTMLALLTDVTKGGLMASGPEGGGMIDIDDASTPQDECNTSVELIELKDDREVSYLGNVTVQIMNLTNFMASFAGSGAPKDDGPPKGMLRQCMVVVSNLTKQGAYRAKVRIKHNSETNVAGTTFGVQELYAYGSTVDFKGEEFGFNIPNSTIRVKLNVQNLLTRKFLPPESIISANIVSLRREFPSFQEVDVSSIATSVNVSGGVLSFKAPNLEGFFSMKFRFKVNVSNEIKEGVGSAFFMLKKYIIWAEPQCKVEGFGPCVFSGKGNVSLKVYIADASKGTLLDRGDTSSALCSTCDGLVAKIKMLRNDQLGKEIPSSEFTTYGGSVTNGTATLNISSSSGGFASGWYGTDIEVSNPANKNESYFGFGWFEIRNFFVEVMSVSVDEATGNLTASWSGWEGSTYAVNQSIAFAVIPRNPFDWSILPVQNVTIASVQRVDMWPPVDVNYTLAGISEKKVYMDMGGFKQPMSVTVVNITGMSKVGMYRANVKVTTANGSDIGTMWFDVASFKVNVNYRGMDMWPPTFGSDENLTVVINATKFDGTPHALDVNKTRLASFFDIKRGHPLKRNSTTTCSNNVCNISIELSGLKSGDYEARLKVVDTSGAKKEVSIWFVIRNLVVGVPSIDEVWLWESDTAKKEIRLEGIDPAQLVPPGNYTSSYKGCVNNMIEDEWFFKGLNISARSLCFFHNTTRLWVSVNANFSNASSGAVKEIITDPYGGKWKVDGLNKNQITLRGINVLAKTGAWLNASLSKSGIIKLGRMEEQWLGGWDPATGRNRGLDLDGDGNTNGTAYIAIADSQTSGIYDTLFFSLDNNFSNYGSVNDAPENRTFASGRFTLLSVDPRADRIRIYTKSKGDWANLGDVRLGQMVNVPVIVTTPAGTPVLANVSIKHVRKESLKGPPEIITLPSPPTATINGTGEVQFNLSKYNLSSGTYAFEIEVQVKDNTEILEEWMWPRVNVRAFLVSGGQGTAGYIGEFKPLPVYRHDGMTYGGNIPELFEVNVSGVYFPLAMDHVDNFSAGPSPGNCTEPGDAGSDPTNYTLQSGRLSDASSSYYYYLTAANASKVWIKKGSCDFASGAEVKSVNDTVNIVLNNRNYTMSVLAANASAGGLVVIGVGSNSLNQDILNNPLRQDPEKRWSIMSFTVGGTTYNAILANASVPYPMCKQWNIQDCAKAAYFTTDGNYSASQETLIGEPIMPSSDLYLARIGPSAWDGILIANSSQVGVRPGLDVRVEDGYTPAFATLNEGQLGFDLNLDNDTGDVFYAVTFDDYPDGVARATGILVDDELNITQDWWGEGWNGSVIINPKDFYGNESGKIFELRGNLPSAIWGGQLGFAPRNESMPYEEQPWWDVKVYNGTHMLLMKDRWSIKQGENITFVVRAYDFDQKAIAGANVTIEKVVRFNPMSPPAVLKDTDYILNKVQDITDARGYGVLTIAPVSGTWEKGDYMVTLSVSKSGGSERIEMWFKVGGW